jgi:hypothetical protein
MAAVVVARRDAQPVRTDASAVRGVERPHRMTRLFVLGMRRALAIAGESR